MNNSIGTLYIVSAASGTGKTSLMTTLVASLPNLKISISYTTRAPRPSEKNGKDYFFVSQEKFDELIVRGEFLEYAHIFGRSYATSRTIVERDLKAGTDIILEIDWQGARQIREKIPEAVSIFILPPSQIALHERITGRDQDHPDMIRKRLAAAAEEISHYAEYDYLVVNDDFNEALEVLKCIIKANRYRQAKQAEKLQSLLAELVEKQT
ncbi:MAG: guanylate kinase [Gammaproteobacteria bacterium]|nr:guanylate kinase [Gammaproteobacteria bacterium]